jgi:ATP sulfurylase
MSDTITIIDKMCIRLGSKYPIPLSFDIEEYYKLGVVRKEDLVDGKTYIGICRNATTAKWDAEKNVFTYLRTKFNLTFPEDINHIADDDGYDLFIPIKLFD